MTEYPTNIFRIPKWDKELNRSRIIGAIAYVEIKATPL